MTILGIETSCDETAISIIETKGKIGGEFRLKILANEVLSQIAVHQQYGGVFPMAAKREHSKNLTPLLRKALKSSGFWKESKIKNYELQKNTNEIYSQILKNLRIDKERETEMWEQFEKEIPKLEKPPIDAVAVTKGPGLEPALWTGINFAKALSAVWNVPLIPINHMEGHIFAGLLQKCDQPATNNPQPATIDSVVSYKLSVVDFPAVALLISGGHTELIKINNWFDYTMLGATRDDAVGEAFDKVARILGLPYPGGPQISALAEIARNNAEQTQTEADKSKTKKIKFPRPMIKSGDYDFSFSGIKTSVLYLLQKLTHTDQASVREGLRPVGVSRYEKSLIAREFEDAVIEVLVAKTHQAILETGAKTLIVGGGVAANQLLRQKLAEMAQDEQTEIFISEISHSTDNALMIATAASVRFSVFGPNIAENDFKASGNWRTDKINN